MAEEIQWRQDLEAAEAEAQEEKRSILIDFFNPG